MYILYVDNINLSLLIVLNCNVGPFNILFPQYRPDSRLGQSHFSPLRGVGGGPPLCIGKQEVGTYICSLLYTHTGLLG
jgi:hypothetical protein